jgi:ankyrin repeat protein
MKGGHPSTATVPVPIRPVAPIMNPSLGLSDCLMPAATELQTRLIDHDFEGAARWLAEGGSIEATAARGRPVVQWALERGDRAIVDWVLDQHPILSPALMPLLLQRTRDYKDPALLQRLLLQGGTDALNATDPATGRTPLMHALHASPFDVGWCRTLIQAGAQVNAQGAKGGDSMLMVALNENRHALIKDFAAAGADPNLPNHNGQVAAHAAMGARDDRVLLAFLEHFPNADLNKPANSGTPPIMFHGSPKTIAALLHAGASANVRSANRMDERETLLMYLVKIGASSELIELALAKGADPTVQDDKGRTVAAMAVHTGRWEVLSACHEHKLPFQAPLDRLGTSPYHGLLALPGPMAMMIAIEHLDRVPVDVGVTDGPLPPHTLRLASPLYLAQAQGRGDLAHLMMTHGAQLTTLGPDGTPSLHGLADWAAQRADATVRYEATRAAIQSVEGADAQRAESLAKLDEDQRESAALFQQWVDTVIAKGPDWNVTDPQGRTLLHRLAEVDTPALAAQLVHAGAAPLIPNAEQQTALDIAFRQGQVATLHAWKAALAAQGAAWHPDLARWVLDSPTDVHERMAFQRSLESLTLDPQWSAWVNTPDADGNTPLILAVATNQADLVTFFLAHGAQAIAANALGETALHHAVATESVRCMEPLLAAGADPYATTEAGLSAWDLAGETRDLKQVLESPHTKVATWPLSEGVVEAVARGEQCGQKNPTPAVRRRRHP